MILITYIYLLTDNRRTVMHIVTSDKMQGIENKTDINDGISEILI